MTIFKKFKQMHEDIIKMKNCISQLHDMTGHYSNVEFPTIKKRITSLEKQMSALMNHFKLSVSIDPARTIPERVFITKDE